MVMTFGAGADFGFDFSPLPPTPQASSEERAYKELYHDFFWVVEERDHP